MFNGKSMSILNIFFCNININKVVAFCGIKSLDLHFFTHTDSVYSLFVSSVDFMVTGGGSNHTENSCCCWMRALRVNQTIKLGLP